MAPKSSRTLPGSRVLSSDCAAEDEDAQLIGIEQIERQFERVQALLSRVDAKVNVVFAITSAEIALASLAVSRDSLHQWTILILAASFVCAIAVSLHDLYRCTFPHIQSHGGKSLVYFADVSQLDESTAVRMYSTETRREFKNDLIVQTWRTSVIAAEKFRYLRRATLAALLSLLPWVGLLALSAWMR